MSDRLKRLITAALRDHLDGHRRRPPEAGIILWNAFAQLSAARTWHAHGPNPIGYAEIEAWCRLMRVPLEPGHVQIIRAMDQVWLLDAQSQLADGKGHPDPAAGKKLPRMSKKPLTAALFDAAFGGGK